MSLFTHIVKEKTKEDYILELAARVVQINNEVKSFLIQKVKEAFDIVNEPNILPDYALLGDRQESPFGVTTQDILDCLEVNGISTLKLYQSSGALQDFLLFSTDGEYNRLIPKSFTVVEGKIVAPEPVVEKEFINE